MLNNNMKHDYAMSHLCKYRNGGGGGADSAQIIDNKHPLIVGLHIKHCEGACNLWPFVKLTLIHWFQPYLKWLPLT